MEEAQVSQPLNQNIGVASQTPAQPVQPVPPVQPVQPVPPVQPVMQAMEQENNDVQQNVYQSIIDQQQAQIDALMAQTERLNGQITQMVQNGVQFAQTQQPQQVAQVQSMMQNTQYQAPMQQLNTPALSDDNDYTLDSLAKEIGRPRESV